MIECKVHERIRDVPEAEWNRLVAPGDPPFVSWTFLDALERAGCVAASRGWLPMHLTLWQDGRLVGAAPAYAKGHSEGEFVFDWSWADLARRLRVRYYPKLILAVPFTPAGGPRLLVVTEADRDRLLPVLGEGVRRLVGSQGLSSAHVLFPQESEAHAWQDAGFMPRLGVQFQWHNQGYGSFDDFLSTFSSKRRNQIRRERRDVQRLGIRIETLRGAEITDEAIDAMYGFYTLTVDKFTWGRQYLNREFFLDVCERMKDHVEIVLARDGAGRPIGGAFNVASRDVLYGRYWGAREAHPFLHFEVCYYHSIEECIARRRLRFEPGAGGEHKRARGFAPTLTHSAHYIADARLGEILGAHLVRECEHVRKFVTGEETDDELEG
jgi:predicted N-acyltransferase